MAFRSSANASSASTTSQSVTKPAGTVDGDVLVANVTFGTAATITPPAGWGLLNASGDHGSGRGTNIYSKFAASEGASWAWGFSSAVGVVIAVSAHSGLASATPNASNGQNNASSVNAVAPSINTTADGCDLIACYGSNGNVTTTAPGGMTEREDLNGGTSRTASLHTETLGAMGATGTRTAVLSGAQTNHGWVGAFAPLVTSPASLLLAAL